MEKVQDRFFGEIEFKSNKYFTFNNVIDEDNFIIITNNITVVKDSLVLIVDNNKCVYLKEWNVCPVMNYYEGVYAFAVKLNRKYFKTYTFKSDFKCVTFDQEDTFDSLMEVAKEQQEAQMQIKDSWGKARVDWKIEYRCA